MTILRSVAAIAAMAVAFVPQAHAIYTLTVTESGSDVVATGSGALDTSALTFNNTTTGLAQIYPFVGGVIAGGTGSQSIDVYYGLVTFPTSLGIGLQAFPDSGSGDAVGGSTSAMYLPAGYTSSSALSTTMTFTGKSFSSMGLSPGTYVWTWESDSFRVVVSSQNQSEVPEPASMLLLGMPMAAMLMARRRRTS